MFRWIRWLKIEIKWYKCIFSSDLFVDAKIGRILIAYSFLVRQGRFCKRIDKAGIPFWTELFCRNRAAGIEVVACRNGGRFFCWQTETDEGRPRTAYKKTAGMRQLQTESPLSRSKKNV